MYRIEAIYASNQLVFPMYFAKTNVTNSLTL